MTKVTLIGTPQTQYQIDGHYYNGGTTVDLKESIIKDNKEIFYVVEDKEKAIPKEMKEEEKEIDKEEIKLSQPLFTKEDLQKIADEKGIAGLREIGDKMNIKFRSVEEGIRELLAAQNQGDSQ